MTSFNDREKAFENKFAHDAELRFKAEARRNRLLGEWAGSLLGKSGEDLQDYIRSVIKSDFEEAGDEDVYRKLAADLDGHADEKTIRDKMRELDAQARQDVLASA